MYNNIKLYVCVFVYVHWTACLKKVMMIIINIITVRKEQLRRMYVLVIPFNASSKNIFLPQIYTEFRGSLKPGCINGGYRGRVT